MEQPSESQDTTVIAAGAARGVPEAWIQLYERFTPALYTWASLRIRPDLQGGIL